MFSKSIPVNNTLWNRLSPAIPLWLVKCFNYEYWPFYIFYLPVFIYCLWLSIKAKSLTWITSANPSILFGGIIGESKYSILRMLNEKYLPVTVYIKKNTNSGTLLDSFNKKNLQYPVIGKPDIGERGKGIVVINNEKQLLEYHNSLNEHYIIQEYISYEMELGIFYYRYPNEEKGRISSVTGKKFLSITGNGVNTLQELMQHSNRARFQIKRIKKIIGKDAMSEVLPFGQERLIEPIGNHSRGTRFINRNDLINTNLAPVFDKILLDVDGFYYGRLDIKVKSLENLYKGENIKILEINGVSSEPGHIYDQSNMNLFTAWRELIKHYRVLYKISMINHQNGIAYSRPKDVIKHLKNFL